MYPSMVVYKSVRSWRGMACRSIWGVPGQCKWYNVHPSACGLCCETTRRMEGVVAWAKVALGCSMANNVNVFRNQEARTWELPSNSDIIQWYHTVIAVLASSEVSQVMRTRCYTLHVRAMLVCGLYCKSVPLIIEVVLLLQFHSDWITSYYTYL